MEMSVQLHASTALAPRSENAVLVVQETWRAPRPLMDILENINVFCSFRKSNHDYRVVQPAAFYLHQLHFFVSVYVFVVYVVALSVAETI